MRIGGDRLRDARGEGKKLDVAKGAIQSAGINEEVKVDGGGVLGGHGIELDGLRANTGGRDRRVGYPAAHDRTILPG